MNTTLQARKINANKNVLYISVIVALAAVLIVLFAWNNGNNGPAPSLTGKILSVVPATASQKARDNTTLGTILIRRNDGYELRLTVFHATGNGCLGDNALHLSDIHVGEITTVRYWLDSPDSKANPHTGHAVYVGDRC